MHEIPYIIESKVTGIIYVGDGCSTRNVLVTVSDIFVNYFLILAYVTNIQKMAPTLKFSHRHPDITNIQMSSTSLSPKPLCDCDNWWKCFVEQGPVGGMMLFKILTIINFLLAKMTTFVNKIDVASNNNYYRVMWFTVHVVIVDIGRDSLVMTCSNSTFFWLNKHFLSHVISLAFVSFVKCQR